MHWHYLLLYLVNLFYFEKVEELITRLTTTMNRFSSQIIDDVFHQPIERTKQKYLFRLKQTK